MTRGKSKDKSEGNRAGPSASTREATARPKRLTKRRAGARAAEGPTLQQREFHEEITTRLLAARGLDEQTALIADALTSRAGYAHAAVALADWNQGVLRVRAASGFPSEALSEFEIPLGEDAPQVRAAHGASPVWIERDGEEAATLFLERIGSRTDLIALPLCQSRSNVEPSAPDEIASAVEEFDPMRPSCLGVLYVGAGRDEIDDEQFHLLVQFAERVGLILSNTIRTENLNSTVLRLERERQWVESIMQSVADPIILTDMNGDILLENQRARELFGGTADASEGKLRALEMNALLFTAYLSSASVEETPPAVRALTLADPVEGTDIHFEVISTPALDAGGGRIGTVSVFRDISDLRRANEELARNFARLQRAEAEARRERDQLDLVLAHVGLPIVVCDETGAFILLNQSAARLLRAPDGVDERTSSTTRDNSAKLASFISALVSVEERGRQAEIEMLDPETGDKLPMEVTSAEVTDAEGQTTAVVSILHDLSEIRELERRRVEQQLFESEKLAAVGRLAASIAHEVNNPLEAIKNSLYLLKSSRNVEQHERFLEVARKETERVSHIVRQMLGFARRSGEVESVDLNFLLEETLILIEKRMEQAHVRLVREFDAALPLVRARADQLRQVFLNLLLNAQQAVEGEGAITIRTMSAAREHRPSIAVEISDTGRGIKEADMARIFEPFFSTRAKGTGLGLWVTDDIVRHHGGRIEVTSAPGRGTTFRVIIPINPAATIASRADG